MTQKSSTEIWTKKERDKALDLYFAGKKGTEIGLQFKDDSEAFLRILNRLRKNSKKEGHEDEPGRAERYKPVQRVSRKGKKLTPNEEHFIRCHQELKLDPAVTAKILCRDVSEIDGSSIKKKITANELRNVPTIDIIWALRYAYFGWKEPIVSDDVYDDMVKEEIEYASEKSFARVKMHAGWPDPIKSLAMYLADKHNPKKS